MLPTEAEGDSSPSQKLKVSNLTFLLVGRSKKGKKHFAGRRCPPSRPPQQWASNRRRRTGQKTCHNVPLLDTKMILSFLGLLLHLLRRGQGDGGRRRRRREAVLFRGQRRHPGQEQGVLREPQEVLRRGERGRRDGPRKVDLEVRIGVSFKC